MEKRGLLFFGINNKNINYVLLSLISALFAKINLGKDISCSLITDDMSLGWNQKHRTLIDGIFDKVILIKDESNPSNLRKYRDTQYFLFDDEFRNSTRTSAYTLSPYDETILIDSDYLILSNYLNKVWGVNEEFLCFDRAIGLNHKELDGPEFRINPYGIRMFWATVLYFKKSHHSKMIFDMMEHIKENWGFYKLVYEMPNPMYRNDFALSIALHTINGFTSQDIPSFHARNILTVKDTDQICEIKSPQEIIFFENDVKENYKFYVTKIRGIDVHVINKISILNNSDKLIELLYDTLAKI